MIYFWFIPDSPKILSVETDRHRACQITAILPLWEWDSADHSTGCPYTMQNTKGHGRHVHRVNGWSRRVITTSWMPSPHQLLPAEMKEEDSPTLLKKLRACMHNELKKEGTVGQDGLCSPAPFLWHMIIQKKTKNKLMPQNLVVCTTNTAHGPTLMY